ncbi:MAG TPA: Maf family protein [Vicinamibacteria bacterium]|nr:Maf family protein [Vicinamibacteria bacterium]
MVVLASASPRRAQILSALGVPHQVAVADVDEAFAPGERAEAGVERLARAKAAAVAAGGLPVLAADTVVVCDGVILGKPGTDEEAAAMLRRLSGRTHEVVTGVCLRRGEEARSAHERTAVTFVELSDADVEWYVATGEPRDKAGAYHVDGRGAVFIARVDGSPSNVAGLPVTLVWRLARELGVGLGATW